MTRRLTLNDAASPQLPNTTGEQTFTAGGELYLLSMHAGGGSIVCREGLSPDSIRGKPMKVPPPHVDFPMPCD